MKADRAIEVLVPLLRDSSPGVRDAAGSVLESVGAAPGGARAALETARRLRSEDPARAHLLLIASERLHEELSFDERDEALLGPIRLMAAEAAASAAHATELATKWCSLEGPKRDALLAGFEAAVDGLTDALPLAATVLDGEDDPERRRRLLQLVLGSRHPHTRAVLDRIVAFGDKEESVAARRALMTLTASDPGDGPRSEAWLTGVDAFGRFEVMLASPRFCGLWEIFVVRIDVDSGKPADWVHTSFGDRSEVDEFGTTTTGPTAQLSPGEAGEIVGRAVARLLEDGRDPDRTLSLCARAARTVTRRSMLPAQVGESSGGIESGPTFDQVGLRLTGEARKVMLEGLEVILPRAKGDDRKLEELVTKLARSLASSFDSPELRRKVASRAFHQAALLRAREEDDAASGAAFLGKDAQDRPMGESDLAVRMIANAILAELRLAAAEQEEAALRRTLRERFFGEVVSPTRGDLAALDLCEIIAESLADRDLDLPDQAPVAARAIAVAVEEALHAPGTRRLPVVGARQTPLLAEETVAAAARPVLDRCLGGLDPDTRAELCDEIAAFIWEVCLSRCPHRCHDDPSVEAKTLFESDDHPSGVGVSASQ